MLFSEIEQCELGAVLWHKHSRRTAVLVALFGPPLNNASIQYLDGDNECIEGCKLEFLEFRKLRAGTLLEECESSGRVVLVAHSEGPDILVHDIEKQTRKKASIIIQKEGKMRAAFVIARVQESTVPRETAP
jgi:hypothetical protein